ncbi:MAG: hypothetical protein AB1529_01375 [Candidatus Micrarchaeota archaeon]
MTDLRRTIKCANCGNESSITLSSDLDVRELLFAGKCRCGNSLQISYSIVGEQAAQQKSESQAESGVVNIDESLFTPDIQSETLRDIIEE